ncbi:adenylate cyclase [Amycolicicoccus subflavus DQS3-9A1] [Mycobacterium shimoidei]|uniref:Adenylate cyclase [Amycolicicoccus subflavus DQS3-9A1] n=1 Tax=Mycobacterium shimoidei TaxID=29313 RepID=A0A375YY09_MYCSH|nr:adenylate cyclase [Amycolicicoccus subflavus DQS3-9A1] [Mycobacterium shimoidei]
MNRLVGAPRRTITGLSVRYGAALAGAHLLSVAEILVIVLALSGNISGGVRPHLNEKYVIAGTATIALGTIAVSVGGAVIIRPLLRWFVPGREPDTAQHSAAMSLMRNQALLIAATWVASGALFIVVNLDGGLTVAISTVLAVIFGGAAATGTAVLLTQRTIRPIIAAATKDFEGFVPAPGVLARLLNMWLLCSGLPSLAIVAVILLRSNGWLIPKTASVEVPVLVLSLVAVMLGLRGMILVSRSIADPVSEVVDAMAEIEQGQIGAVIDVYERSEIGRLQRGFNRMVAGLSERDRLRDLFGRHVGTDVARRAVQEGATLSGEVSEAAILFVDLVGSTQLAANRPPEEVAEVLNDFFRIVVVAVDEQHGLINKFQGDAALAVFGVPLRNDRAASAALATARMLATRLRELPMVDFGIGVSAGPVFAGNIGAENRYEYTVIGDAVNEAARLADLAKTTDRRVLCSAAAVERADPTEQKRWVATASVVLRGRSEETQISTPANDV